jgi:Glycolipid transfer protein (GLTP)
MNVQATIPVAEDDDSYYMIPSTWTVGKISLIFLILASLTDFATLQLKSLESPELYDALSSEVIRPAFSYHSSSSANNHKPKPGLLGSAAISSVTDALSPILPFAGGVDLRREDYWISSSNPFEALRSLATQIHDAFAASKSDASNPEATSLLEKSERTKSSSNSRPPKIAHVVAISAPEPFVKIDVIADLTLGELAQTFQYVAASSKEGFREGRFLSGLSPRLQQIILATKNVAAKSRGATVLDTSVSVASDGDSEAAAPGSFDILKFCAAMRIFAEWRMVRNCPDGYKGFAMGMSLGHKDIVQNLAKIEQAAHSWLDRRADDMMDSDVPAMELRSPTARQLLAGEIELDVHPKLPYLKEKTAGMGLLWVRRQLHYHTQLLDNAMQVPRRFANIKDAVSAAYTEVYDRYHGWAVQKIFNYSFQSAPDEKIIFRHMNPHRLKEAYQAARRKVMGSAPSSNNNNNGAVTAEIAEKEEQQDENPFVSFFNHVGSEWDKIVQNLFKNDDFDVSGSPASSSQQDALEDFVTREMLHDAHEQIRAYLQIVYPMLDELAVIFDENNMDDPTRV